MKITVANIEKEYPKITAKLPEKLGKEEFENIVNKQLKYYNKSEGITKYIDTFIEKLNDVLAKEQPKKKGTLPKNIDSLKAYLEEGQELFYQHINNNSGDIELERKVRVKSLSPDLTLKSVGKPDMIIKYSFLKNVAKFDKDGFSYGVGHDTTFRFLWNTKVAEKTKKKAPKSASKKTSTEKKQAKRKPNEVDLMPLEVKIIRRYINFHNKKVTERQVSLLYKTIQKAATEKTIRKTSKYADEIQKIGNDLAKTYKEMDGICTFIVPESMYSKLKEIVDGYGITPAIALIKRFINLYGNITVDKAKRLLTSIENAKKNGKVTTSDKAYDKINQVQKHLEDYLESDKLIVTQIQLRGLEGLASLGK